MLSEVHRRLVGKFVVINKSCIQTSNKYLQLTLRLTVYLKLLLFAVCIMSLPNLSLFQGDMGLGNLILLVIHALLSLCYRNSFGNFVSLVSNILYITFLKIWIIITFFQSLAHRPFKLFSLSLFNFTLRFPYNTLTLLLIFRL